MAVIEHPLGGLIEGMMQGRQLAMQLHRQAQEDAAFKTNQALHEQQMTMQDIFNQQHLQKIARPVSDLGTVMLEGEQPDLPAIPGVAPAQRAQFERKARSPLTVSDRFGNVKKWEMKTPEEQQQEDLQSQVRGSNALREAQMRQAMQERESQLKLYGGGTAAPPGTGYPAGYMLLPKELQEAQAAIAAREKGDELAVPEGTTIYSRRALRGGSPGVAGPEAPPEMQDVPQPGRFPGQLPLAPAPPGFGTPSPAPATTQRIGPQGQPGGAVIARGQPKATGDLERVWLPAFANSKGMTIDQLRQPENAATLLQGVHEYAQRTKDPDAMALTKRLAQTTLAIANERLETMRAARTTAPMEIPVGSREYNVADMLATGKLTLPQFRALMGRGGDANKKLDIFAKATEINQNFNPALFEMGYKFASNPKTQGQLASVDNVIRGVPDLLRFSDEAARSGIPLLNQAVRKGGYALGGKSYANLHAAQIGFADELSGALGYGGATDMSKEMGLDMTDPNLSPEAFRGIVEDVIVPFVNRKRAAMIGQMGIYGQPGMNPAADTAQQQAGGATAHTIELNGKHYVYKGSGATDDWNNYTEVKPNAPAPSPTGR